MSELSGLLYGVVEWINDNPVLDGMPYFDNKEEALEYVAELEKKGNMGLPCTVKYTIIRLKNHINI